MVATEEGFMVRARWWAGMAMAAALGVPACVPNDNVFFIVQNQVPMSAGVGMACTTSADPSGMFNNQGTLDVTLARSYVMSPLYRSELLTYRDPMAGRSETRGLYVQGATVELRRPQSNVPQDQWPLINLGAGIGTSYTVVTNTFVPPASSSGAGFAVGNLEIIPATVGNALYGQVCVLLDPPARPGCRRPTIDQTHSSQQIVAVVRPFGRTMGGLDVNGAPFTFPVTVCCGCLISYPAEADDPAVLGVDCRGRASPTNGVCSVGQDLAVDCRLCADNILCQPPDYGCQ